LNDSVWFLSFNVLQVLVETKNFQRIRVHFNEDKSTP